LNASALAMGLIAADTLVVMATSSGSALINRANPRER